VAKSKPILIGCPQYGVLVRGWGLCDETGQYLRAPDGTFMLQHARCDQQGGKCMQTLCALHRYNRGGPGTWYPARVLAAPERQTPAQRRSRKSGSAGNNDTGVSVEV